MGKLKKEDRPRNDLTKLSEDLIDGLDTLRRSTITLRDAGALNTKALVMNDPVLLEVDWSARSEISESDLLSALKAYAPSEIEEVFDQLHPDYSPNTDEEYWNTYTDLAATKGGADQLGLLLGRLKSHRAKTKVILKELNGRDVLLRAIDRIIKQPRIKRLLLRHRKEASHYIKKYRVSDQKLLKKISAAEGVLYQHDVPGLLYRTSTKEIVVGPDGEIVSDDGIEPRDWREILGALDPLKFEDMQKRARYFLDVYQRGPAQGKIFRNLEHLLNAITDDKKQSGVSGGAAKQGFRRFIKLLSGEKPNGLTRMIEMAIKYEDAIRVDLFDLNQEYRLSRQM